MSNSPEAGIEGQFIARKLYLTYVLMIALTVLIILIGARNGDFRNIAIGVPSILIILNVLTRDRAGINAPPLIVFLIFGLTLLTIGGTLADDELVNRIVDFTYGVVLGLTGLTVAYSILRWIPDNLRKPLQTMFLSFSIAATFFVLIVMLDFVLYLTFIEEEWVRESEVMMQELVSALAGAAMISLIFYFDESKKFESALNRHLRSYGGLMSAQEYEVHQIMREIEKGESEHVEFKSTLRTNLMTGEKDPRMERAVMKTLVAFLNSDGGTLLIGVSDDGSINGIDEDSFDNRDKLSLHFTNLVAKHIGNDHLPFISFTLNEMGGKAIMRVVCRRCDTPVFLIDGKEEHFYVRSGPSSIDIGGTDLLNYVETRFKHLKRKRL